MASPDQPDESARAASGPGSHTPGAERGPIVWRRCEEVPGALGPTAVTIGVFDGVHIGHQVLLKAVARAAADSNLVPVAVTFDPHPMSVVRAGTTPALLCTCDRRLELLGEAGMAGILVLPFTPARAAQSADDFVAEVLADRLHARHVIVGRNFRFGYRAQGDVAMLSALGGDHGFRVTVLDLADAGQPAVGSKGRGGEAMPDQSAVSSTRIRTLLAEGAVAEAALLLSRPHRVSGIVVRGDARGRELGFPTANLAVPAELLIPADGVYAGWMRASAEPDVWREAAISIGTNPTFDGVTRRVEAYALDVPASYDVYDQVVDVEFVARLRGMARFDSLVELVTQMTLDVAATREALTG